jgi:hypothetical protein
MEKKLTNSGPLMEPADKHSIYAIKLPDANPLCGVVRCQRSQVSKEKTVENISGIIDFG